MRLYNAAASASFPGSLGVIPPPLWGVFGGGALHTLMNIPQTAM